MSNRPSSIVSLSRAESHRSIDVAPSSCPDGGLALVQSTLTQVALSHAESHRSIDVARYSWLA